MATLLLLFASHVLGYSLPGAPLRAAGAATHSVAIYMQMGGALRLTSDQRPAARRETDAGEEKRCGRGARGGEE
jgi:hypothetical protein